VTDRTEMQASTLVIDHVGAGVAEIVLQFGRTPVGSEADLRAAGFTSLDMVNLMLEVEERFDLQVPAARMTPANFRSANAIEALVRSLRPA